MAMMGANHPGGDQMALSLGLRLGTPVVTSDWQILDSLSVAVSVDTPVARLGASFGAFTIPVANKTTHEGIVLHGTGLGVSVGVGVSPVDASGDLGHLPKLPGWNSPIFLRPGALKLSGRRLFEGPAAISSVSAGDGVEGYDSEIFFLDVISPWVFGPFVKATALFTGLDWVTNASAGGSVLFYWVTADSFQCRI